MTTNVEIWTQYAKDRFEAAVKRVDEFRNWARHLGTAVAVLIGLELTLLARALELKERVDLNLRYAFLSVFLLAVIIQIYLLFRLSRIGYVGRTLRGPESPVILWPILKSESPEKTGRILGFYYANSHDRFHALGQELGKKVGEATVFLNASIILFLLAVFLLVFAVVCFKG